MSFKWSLIISISTLAILFILSACNDMFVQRLYSSCTVTTFNEGALISCPDGTTTFIENGQDGTNGLDGQNGTNGQNGQDGQDAVINGFTIVEIINPCGNSPSVYDEVFLKLSNGQIVTSFSDNANGNNTRFSVLEPGSYRTTDGDNCYFTVNSNGEIVNEHY